MPDKEPTGTSGIVDVVFNAAASSFEVTADILRGAVEASPNADFRINTEIKGTGIVVIDGCPIAETKPVSESGGTARVTQSLVYSGSTTGTVTVSVLTFVSRGDSTKIGDAATGSFTVEIPAR